MTVVPLVSPRRNLFVSSPFTWTELQVPGAHKREQQPPLVVNGTCDGSISNCPACFSDQSFHLAMSDPKTTIPVGSLILVTGATGFIAAHVIAKFLTRGYRVRGTARDLHQASWLVNDRFKTQAETGKFELVAVPDFTVDGAFDEAVKGVSAIAHVASVLTFDSNPNNVIPPTVAGVTSILVSALKEPSVKEVVFTSSLMASVFPVLGHEETVDRNSWNELAVKAAWAPPPYDDDRSNFVYAASKVAAEKALWKFVEEKKPHYTVNAVVPSGVTGEPMHEKHADNHVNWVATIFKGQKDRLDEFPASECTQVCLARLSLTVHSVLR